MCYTNTGDAMLKNLPKQEQTLFKIKEQAGFKFLYRDKDIFIECDIRSRRNSITTLLVITFIMGLSLNLTMLLGSFVSETERTITLAIANALLAFLLLGAFFEWRKLKRDRITMHEFKEKTYETTATIIRFYLFHPHIKKSQLNNNNISIAYGFEFQLASQPKGITHMTQHIFEVGQTPWEIEMPIPSEKNLEFDPQTSFYYFKVHKEVPALVNFNNQVLFANVLKKSV